MEKVCLIKAGNFLLGIDASHIIDIIKLKDLDLKKENKKKPVFFLKSFFTQQGMEIEGAEIVTLKNRFRKEHLTVLIDEKVNEIKPPDIFEPTPLLYPELASLCCPNIFIHGDQIVLLLEPKQLGILFKKLRSKYGLITFKDLQNILPVDIEPAEDKEAEDSYTQASEADIPENLNNQDDTNNQESQKITSVIDKDETDESTTEQKPDIKIQLSDDTITKIVSWIFNRYNSFNGNNNQHILVEDLPSDILSLDLKKGINRDMLQELINKIIRLCEKKRYQTMKNMIKERLNKIQF